MYADDLLLSHGRLSAAKGTVTLSVGCRLNWYRALRKDFEEATKFLIDQARADPKLRPLIDRIRAVQ